MPSFMPRSKRLEKKSTPGRSRGRQAKTIAKGMSQKTLDGHFAKLDALLQGSQLKKSMLSYSTLFRHFFTNSIGWT